MMNNRQIIIKVNKILEDQILEWSSKFINSVGQILKLHEAEEACWLRSFFLVFEAQFIIKAISLDIARLKEIIGIVVARFFSFFIQRKSTRKPCLFFAENNFRIIFRILNSSRFGFLLFFLVLMKIQSVDLLNNLFFTFLLPFYFKVRLGCLLHSLFSLTIDASHDILDGRLVVNILLLEFLYPFFSILDETIQRCMALDHFLVVDPTLIGILCLQKDGCFSEKPPAQVLFFIFWQIISFSVSQED